MTQLNFSNIHRSWLPVINHALLQMDPNYIEELTRNPNWLPGHHNIFNAFTLPRTEVKFILFGESPYPRVQSANGYAFWDNNVKELWSLKGLSKQVNRATSLRNIIKMLLIARNDLTPKDMSQEAIAKIKKDKLIVTIDELFLNIMKHGILLLNATLVLSNKPVKYDAREWQSFMNTILEDLPHKNEITLILLGKIAGAINTLPTSKDFKHFYAEHPYNLSFITNPKVIEFFRPLNLLERTDV